MKNRKWKFQHLRRRVGPGEGENRACSSQSPTSLFARRIQWRLPFVRRGVIYFCRFLKVGFGCLSEKEDIFSDKTAIYSLYIRNWNCNIFSKFQTDVLNKRQTSLDVSRKKANRTFDENGPDSPVLRVKHAYEGAETSIFGFQIQRWPNTIFTSLSNFFFFRGLGWVGLELWRSTVLVLY